MAAVQAAPSGMEKGDPRIIKGWVFYDWANSVYSLVITSSVFQVYFSNVTTKTVDFFGVSLNRAELYAYHISFAFAVIAFASPLLSAIADYTGSKKRFMQFFAYLGSAACVALYFFEGNLNVDEALTGFAAVQHSVEYGIICSVIASIGFSGSIVFYNAYLPEIAEPEDHDRISARGFSMGYIGSLILLAFNLSMILMPDLYGIPESNSKLPAQISFLSVGLWWFGFSQITFSRLPNNVFDRKPEGNVLTQGYQELGLVWQQLRNQPHLKSFLYSFFFFNMGVQTVMYLAATYGKEELNLDDGVLIPTIMIIQLVAVAGAWYFARLSGKRGNLYGLRVIISCWIVICLGAAFITGAVSFMIVGAAVGLVMGGIQSLARSTYSKMLPATHDHASYFSFYDVMDKSGTVLGTATFGILAGMAPSQKYAIIAISGFFLVGLLLLRKVKHERV